MEDVATVEQAHSRAIAAATFVAWWENLLERAQQDSSLLDDDKPIGKPLEMFMLLGVAGAEHGVTQAVHSPAIATQEATLGYRLHPGFPWNNPNAAVRFPEDLGRKGFEQFVADLEAVTGIKAEYAEEESK